MPACPQPRQHAIPCFEPILASVGTGQGCCHDPVHVPANDAAISLFHTVEGMCALTACADPPQVSIKVQQTVPGICKHGHLRIPKYTLALSVQTFS
eukprot:1158416-Pelagomonas_calceolata.AAC.3